jgi:hypothetical protein
MRSFAVAGMIASLTLGLASARVDAQGHTTKPPATTAKPAPAAPPASSPSHGPVIAPSKPVVAPVIAPLGDAGATPATARPAGARTLSVSARQAAEQTIAALVAAMKNMPKRPPAPPESRTSRAKSADATARGQAAGGPTPIIYRVTWPATQPELGLDTRVELDWPGRASTAPVSLRWNEPTPD